MKNGGGSQQAELMLAFRQAMTLHQSGRIDEAERLYRDILRHIPNHPGPLHFLGVIEAQRGRHGEAVAWMDRAIAADPKNPAVHYNRANSLRELKRQEEALVGFDLALAAKPDHVAALNNRGTLLQELGRRQEALASFDRALVFDPNNTGVLSNRGYLLAKLRRPADALNSCDRALGLDPNHAGAWNNRGNALRDLKRPEEALVAYERSLSLDRDNPDTLVNRGNALRDLRRYGDALASYDRALEIRPAHINALANRGFLFMETGDHDAAVKTFAQALLATPDHADSLYGLGQCFLELKRHDDAVATYERLVAAAPSYSYATGMLLHARRMACDWHGLSTLAMQVRDQVRRGERAITPYAFVLGSDSPADNFLCAKIVVEMSPSRQPLLAGERYRRDKIRVAYLSADFRVHPVASLIAGVLEEHDKTSFETIGISYGPDDRSAMRTRLQKSFDRFLDVRDRSDSEAADLIRDLEADIAVDLTGFTAEGRYEILSRRPAPVQVNYLGYPATMAASHYDYILADACVIPDEDKSSYSEKIAALPFSYMPTDSKRRVGPRPTRKEAGLPEAGFVFCSFNNAYKITPEIFDVWMRLLSGVENSVLWLSAANDAAQRNLRREAERRGIDPGRLVFARYVAATEDHLARLRLADLFLDTLPCNAHTTANDALLAGLPVLTARGGSFAGRVASSLLAAAGLPEMIAESLDDYETLAFRLARNRDALGIMRAKLAHNREGAPLFDTVRFCRHLESAYRTMWERYRRGEAPSSFAVEPV